MCQELCREARGRYDLLALGDRGRGRVASAQGVVSPPTGFRPPRAPQVQLRQLLRDGGASFRHAAEVARQRALIDIMLILADADSFGLDLHELSERVLQPPGDRHRAADRAAFQRDAAGPVVAAAV